MEALAQYLLDMPQLSEVLLETLGENLATLGIDYNNADEMRLAYKEAQQLAMEKLETKKQPYYVITFPQVMYKCPHCTLEIRGAYWEMSNPITRARGMFRVRLMHELTIHNNAEYYEPIVNMNDTVMGEDHHRLDLKKFLKILNGADVPEAVMADLQKLQQEFGGN